MKCLMLVTTAMVAASGAHAGGVERSSQSVAILFNDGRNRLNSKSFTEALKEREHGSVEFPHQIFHGHATTR